MIAVDWSGYPSQEFHVLRASLICDGRSIPLLSQVVPSAKQQNAQIQKSFLDELFRAITPGTRVMIVTDAGFQNAWFRHIKSLGWDFSGRVRGNIQLRLKAKGEEWLRRQALIAKDKPEYLGPGRVLNILSVRAIFISIKKRLKNGNTNEAGVVYPVIRRSVTGGHRQKSRGLFSPAQRNLALQKS